MRWSWKSASKVGVLINHLQSLSIDCDGWRIVGLTRCLLAYDLSFLSWFWDRSCHMLVGFLHSPPCWGILLHVAHLTLLSAPLRWLPTFLEWKQLVIKAVSDWKDILTIRKSICELRGEHHAEHCWCHYKALQGAGLCASLVHLFVYFARVIVLSFFSSSWLRLPIVALPGLFY